MPPNAAERIELIVDWVPKTTKEIMTSYNQSSRTGHQFNYEQVNKALNLLTKQNKILKSVEHASRVLYFKVEE